MGQRHGQATPEAQESVVSLGQPTCPSAEFGTVYDYS